MTKNNIQTSKFKDGDIIFHTSTSGQSKMLQVATKSKLTHVGIIFHIKGVPYVFEAVQPVSYRSLNSFIKSGVNGDYVVLRPRNELTQTQIDIMKNYAMKQMGKNYDIQFTWGNDKMYCSELVYKVYESAGINICAKNKFSSFDLSNEMVKNAIFSRYNKSGKKFDINEVVVAPVDIYKSWNLKTVESTYSFF
jgi:hypothetical protein